MNTILLEKDLEKRASVISTDPFKRTMILFRKISLKLLAEQGRAVAGECSQSAAKTPCSLVFAERIECDQEPYESRDSRTVL